MKKILLGLLAAALCSSCASQSAKRTRYLCTCGTDCHSCTKVSDKPGNCECGKPRKAETAP